MVYSDMPLALPTNIILRWKGLQGTNTIAYYKYSLNTDIKSFITLDPGVSALSNIFIRLTIKLERLSLVRHNNLVEYLQAL